MRTAQPAGAAFARRGATSAAAARVALSASRYFGLSRNVRSPGPASSSAATSTMARPPSVAEASLAPHQSATSESRGAQLGGKKRILAKKQVPSDVTTGAPARGAPAFRVGLPVVLERGAAGEVEDLGLVVLVLVHRHRKIEPDRTHRRGPKQARADRGSNLIRVPNGGAARLSDEQHVLARTIGVMQEAREVRLPGIADQIAGVGEHRAAKPDFPRQAEDREVDFRRGSVIGRSAE